MLRPGNAGHRDDAGLQADAVVRRVDPRGGLDRVPAPPSPAPSSTRWPARRWSPRGPPPTWSPTRSRTAPAPPCAPGSRARSAAARRSCRSPSMASRPSVQHVERRRGREAVELSRVDTMSAPARAPARASRSATRTPCQPALPTRLPPTSFETQASVIHRSICGIASRSAQSMVSGRCTMPCTFSFQLSVGTRGSTNAVSTR